MMNDPRFDALREVDGNVFAYIADQEREKDIDIRRKEMGDMADDIIDGDCCQVCGQYFNESQGYPCTCTECGGDKELL